MVSVLLFILKIILYILLVLCSIIIIIIGIVLFLPISYKIEGEKYNDIKLELQVFWLFKLIRVNLNYNSEFNYKVKIFWKTISSSEKVLSNKKAKNKNKINLTSSKSYHNDNREITKNTDINNNQKESTKEDVGSNLYNKDKTLKNNKKSFNKHNNKSNVNNGQEKNKYSKKLGNKKGIFKKNNKVKEKKDYSKNLDSLKKIINNLKNNKEALLYILKQIKSMIKAIFPRKSKILLKLGTGDPATTGYITGMLSISYTFLKSLVIEPNFENKQLEGEVYFKGRIFLIVFVYYIIKLILDKKVRKLIFSINN